MTEPPRPLRTYSLGRLKRGPNPPGLGDASGMCSSNVAFEHIQAERNRANAYARALRDLGHDPDELYPQSASGVEIGERQAVSKATWDKGVDY